MTAAVARGRTLLLSCFNVIPSCLADYRSVALVVLLGRALVLPQVVHADKGLFEQVTE